MFKKVGRRRSGSYTCEVHNQFGSTLSKPLRITIKSDDSVDPTSSETETQEETLAAAPTAKLEFRPAGDTFKEGADVKMECVVTANPPATSVEWIHVEHQIYEDIPKGIVMDPVVKSGNVRTFPLTLQSVDRYLAGKYQCKAKNGEGVGESNVVDVKINYAPSICRIQVLPKPKPLDSEWYIENQDIVMFQCTTDSKPPPHTYIWQQGRYTIMPSHSDLGYKLHSNGILELNPLKRTMAGTFTCIATNSVGRCSTAGYTSIKVAHKPVIQFTYVTNTDPHWVPEWTHVKMKCYVSSAYPSVDELVVYKDGKAIRWYKKQPYIHTINVWQVSIPRAAAGNFTCSATNIAGTTFSNTTHTFGPNGWGPHGPLRVNVVWVPEVIVNQTTGLDPTKIKTTDVVEFSCTVNAFPTATLAWKHNGKLITSSTPGMKLGPEMKTLTLKPVTHSMAGDYTCVATNKLGTTSSAPYKIAIATPANVSVLMTNGNPKRVKVGTTVELLCKVHVAVPKVTGVDWKFNDEPIAGDKYYKILKDRTLTIKNIAEDAEGEYTCVGHNGDFKGIWSPPLHIHILTPPLVEVIQITEVEPSEAPEGSTIILRCNVSAEPPHTSSKWYFNNEELNSKKGVEVKGLSLELESLTRHMKGSYKCGATNDVGSAQSLPFKIIVFHKPIVAIDMTVAENEEKGGGIISTVLSGLSHILFGPADEPVKQTKGTMDVMAGSDVTFEATIVAVPTYHTLEWARDAETVTNDESKGILIKGRKLIIKHIPLNLAGEYKCTAINDQGQAESNIIIVKVFSGPKVEIVQTTNVHQLEVKEHIHSVTLMCKVVANPPVGKVTWKLKGNVIGNKAGFRMTDRSLVLSPTHRSMTGNYTCEGTNKHGTGYSNKYPIRVLYMPECQIAPINIPWPNSIKYNSDVTMLCKVIGEPKPQRVTWVFEDTDVKADEEGIYFDGPRLKLKGVSERRSGSYRCKARNVMGECLSETYGIKILNIPDAKIRLVNIVDTNNLLEGDTVRLECVIKTGLKVDPVVWKNNKKIQWDSKAKGIMKKNRTINLSPIHRNMSGNYTCQGQGTKESDPYPLTIINKPAVKLVLQTMVNPLFVQEGTTLNFKCVAGEANPSVMGYRWKVDGYLMYHEPKRDIYIREDHLELKQAKRDAAGNYTCTALHVVEDVESNIISIGIKYGPDVKLTLRPDFNIDGIMEGMSPELKCDVSANPPPTEKRIEWMRNGESVGHNVSTGVLVDEEVGTLTLRYVSRTQAGTYTCAFVDTDGIAVESNAIALDIKYPPAVKLRMISKLDPHAIQEGTDVRFVCDAEAHPPIKKIEWFHEFAKLAHSKTTDIKGNQLLLREANRTRRGVYACTAANSVASLESNSIYINFVVEPKVKLVVDNDQDTTVVQGGTLHFTCMDENSFPPVTDYRWRHNDEIIEGGIGVIVDSARMDFLNMHKDHEGEYYCEGSNGHSTGVSNEVIVSVIYPPVCKLTSQNTDGVLVPMNTLTEIVCNVHSHTPDVKFSWTFNNTKMKRPKKTDFKVDNKGRRSTVHFIPATCDDYGTLMCYAENEAGPMEEPCVFQVYSGKPEVGNLKLREKHLVPNKINTGTDFSMACPVICSYPPVVKYGWRINQTSLNRFRSPNLVYYKERVLVKNAGRRRTGAYQCVATNIFGDTVSKPLHVIVRSSDGSDAGVSSDPTTSETDDFEPENAENVAKVYINRPFAYIVLADRNILLAGTYQ